jgi:hypothetical protein
MTPQYKAARDEAISERWPNKGPCLIAREGANVPNCHENDFCLCDMETIADWAYAQAQAEVERLRLALWGIKELAEGAAWQEQK